MLFYRRKSLLRPLEARGNPKYMMPERLLKLAEEENAELERQREEYETALNTINLQVHLGNNYKCSNGVLEAKPNEVCSLDLAIDKRKLLMDLRDSVSKLCAGLYSSQEFVLHTAREVPAGLHLYEELSESQNLETLKDLGILEGTKVFVWDGLQVGGEHFAIGVAHEPVLLTITVTLPNGETTEMSRGFPKTTTIGELKALISSLAPLPLEDIRVSRQDLQGEDARLSPLNESRDTCTLAELSFIDGDHIVADNFKDEEMQTKEIGQNQVTIVVQNFCKEMAFSENSRSPAQLVEITLDSDSIVENLRAQAVFQLGLDSSRSYILRKLINGQNRKPPLYEHQTIREAGLLDVSIVTIEEGSPPLFKQITVIFNVGIGLGESPDFEITVNKNISVPEGLRQMLSVAGLSGDTWHLRKTNWCGEPMEQLSMDATLEDEGIQHGENLLVMEGRVPPKGFLNFTIWFFPTLESIPNPQNVNMNGLHSGIENLLQDLTDSVTRSEANISVKLGEVELSCESTVGD
ncbi:Ubiquitin carboxyl-terminal hydrolase 40, partial [Stegodyphus mimosarum]